MVVQELRFQGTARAVCVSALLLGKLSGLSSDRRKTSVDLVL